MLIGICYKKFVITAVRKLMFIVGGNFVHKCIIMLIGIVEFRWISVRRSTNSSILQLRILILHLSIFISHKLLFRLLWNCMLKVLLITTLLSKLQSSRYNRWAVIQQFAGLAHWLIPRIYFFHFHDALYFRRITITIRIVTIFIGISLQRVLVFNDFMDYCLLYISEIFYLGRTFFR